MRTHAHGHVAGLRVDHKAGAAIAAPRAPRPPCSVLALPHPRRCVPGCTRPAPLNARTPAGPTRRVRVELTGGGGARSGAGAAASTASAGRGPLLGWRRGVDQLTSSCMHGVCARMHMWRPSAGGRLTATATAAAAVSPPRRRVRWAPSRPRRRGRRLTAAPPACRPPPSGSPWRGWPCQRRRSQTCSRAAGEGGGGGGGSERGWGIDVGRGERGTPRAAAACGGAEAPPQH